ncbi:MAG: hypothetical protein IJ301_00670 [Clostridia bacterium]|nr:hypothetical protein [Clostridia bacterium]
MNIFIYGDSNTSGLMPASTNYVQGADQFMYPAYECWWSALENKHKLYISGVCGRSINCEHPHKPFCVASQTINFDISGNENADLVILQLGKNDCKTMYNQTAEQITEQMHVLVEKIRAVTPAKIMLISPAKFDTTKNIAKKYYSDGEQKSVELDKCYRQLANEIDAYFVSGLDIPVGIDGEHFTKEGHKQLGQKVLEKVSQIEKNPTLPAQKINEKRTLDEEKARAQSIFERMR